MTQPDTPLTLLIDGNNLAHFLYTNLAPGAKMSSDDSRRLIFHLNAYARTYADHLRVDLCLDRSPGVYDLPAGNMQVCFAEYPQTGDDLLLGRFWFYHINHQPCLVITNDGDIIDEVGEAGGISLKVYDFVRRPGLVSPVFRAPDELPARNPPAVEPEKPAHALSLSTSIYFRIEEEDRGKQTSGGPAVPSQRDQGPYTAPRPPAASTGKAAAPAPEPPAATREETNQPITVEDPPGINDSADEEPYYFLSIDTWPVAEGARFLLNSFCPRHIEQYRDLMEEFNPAALRAADLRALAELLLHACGSEPDFARRGALMARVRLALLQARGDPLTLSELAERTGLKAHGLRGRIRQKAAPWVEIVY